MGELRSGLFFLGLSFFVLWESLRAGLGTLRNPGSGFISFCTAVILSVLSLVLIYRGWRIRISPKHLPRQIILALVFLILYSLALNTLGFVIPTFLLVGLFFYLGGLRPWWALLGMSATVTFLAYLVFGILLHVYLPRGFLGI